MGAVTDALHRAAVEAGAEIVTGAGVSAIRADGATAERRRRPRSSGTTASGQHTSSARHVLANVAPWVLRHPARRARGPRHQARGRPAQDQPPARPAPPAALRASTPRSPSPAPCTSARTTPSSRRRTPTRPPAGCPRRMPGRGLLPLADRPLDPRRRARGHPHADLLRPAHPGRALRRRPGGQGARRRAGHRLPRPAPGRAADRPAWPATPTATRASRPRSRRTSSATWPCPAATSSTATWSGPGPPTAPASRPPPSSWGVQTDHRRGAALRLRRPSRRRRVRPRRPQRRPGRARARGDLAHVGRGRWISISPRREPLVTLRSLHHARH